MWKSWIRPIAAIAVVWLSAEVYLDAPALAEESPQYAAKPAGSDGPAGQCVVCHSIEKGAPWRVAPTLWGIVGAPKAGAKGYGYSQALATAGGTWTAQDLDKYLANPGQFLPGTNKVVSLTDASERARIIEFLGTLKD
jgi:cytochrome c